MKRLPKIIMKCPKCQKDFTEDSSYCELCSVMLEPVEVEQTMPEKDTPRSFLKDSRSTKGEKIEDVKIDSLKADIEAKFVSALLHEKTQLRKRLVKKEKALSELEKKKSKMDHSDFLSSLDKKEKEIEEINKKLERLESILYNLKKKIETDILDLTLRVNSLRSPGIFSYLSANGRYYRMISSELKTKNTLLSIIQGKRSAVYLRLVKLSKTFLLIGIVAVISLITSWYILTYSYKGSSSMVDKTEKLIIKEKDIIDLLEDIRKANLNKDLNLWSSRYSRSYLELGGKKESVIEQWKIFDFWSLRYRVDDIKIQPDRATALITWEMELLSQQRKETKILSQRLLADFIIEDGRLKISSVRK